MRLKANIRKSFCVICREKLDKWGASKKVFSSTQQEYKNTYKYLYKGDRERRKERKKERKKGKKVVMSIKERKVVESEVIDKSGIGSKERGKIFMIKECM